MENRCNAAHEHHELTMIQVENLVKRSYQYVALYNIINKYALNKQSTRLSYQWNRVINQTTLLDDTEQNIARPNNDTLYSIALLALHAEPVILEIPAIDSRYVSLETSAYDHYIAIPLSTRKKDYQIPQKILFYSARTRNFNARCIPEGIDRCLEMTGDFVITFHRIMPHASEPERFALIQRQMAEIQVQTLSQYSGQALPDSENEIIPAFGKTDIDVFGHNLLEVMQFVFNHTTFCPEHSVLDKELLESYQLLGIIPGKTQSSGVTIDNGQFQEIAQRIQQEQLALARNPRFIAEVNTTLFREKGHPGAGLETMLFQSVFGPLGLPSDEAVYPPIMTEDGYPMNALQDYRLKMHAGNLPPARAFWSITLYDTRNGFFIPNKEKKYSVGLNAGYQLDAEGGIEIYISEKQPTGVPKENWLPVNRQNQDLDLVLRIYDPDEEKMKVWKAPRAEIAVIS